MSTPAPERPALPPFEPSTRGGVKGLLIGAAAAVAVVTLAVTGALVVGGMVGDDDTAAASPPPAAQEAAPDDTEDVEDTEKIDAAGGEEDAQLVAFGDVATFADGSTLTVGKPVPMKRSDVAAGGEEFDRFVKFEMTYVNNSSEPYDPSGTTTSLSSGGRELDEVFQPGLTYPEKKVRPGRKITWRTGYGVDDTKDLRLTVSLGFLNGYDEVTFTS
jgi:hypothetical protein